jgi:dienelactone hydrolase
MNDFSYSPSLHHEYLMKTIKPCLAFDKQNRELWKHNLRSKLRELLGDFPDFKCPLKVRALWQRKHILGTIEKIVFTTEPFVDVPAYICLPNNASSPYTTFICLQGHSTGIHKSIGVAAANNQDIITLEDDGDFALTCMKNGFAALCVEQRSFGERVEKLQKMKSPHQCHDAVCHALMLGRTLMGERIWDVERSLDYLASRGDIAMDKVGIMGHSGGGAVSIYASAILDRIAYAMPACSFCTYRDSIMNIYHCADNYVPGLLKYAEFADVMGLHAPNPVVIVAGRHDITFPVEAVKKAFEDLRKIYCAFGAEDNCQLVIGEGGHRFYSEVSWQTMQTLINTNTNAT